MQIPSCPRCIPGEFHLPDEVLNDVREELCSLLRQNQRLQGMMILKRKQVPLIDAKFFVFHLANVDGTCHRCRVLLGEQATQVCKKCRSLNLKLCEEDYEVTHLIADKSSERRG